ncbi:MAG: hypothetical protein R3336_04045, partial [Phycisphaeraceae bacterium]|nr:hypothetical protein [Phycisphaeraceae bacterium]
MRLNSHAYFVLLFTGLWLALVPVAPVSAQVSNLDEGQLIDTLRREGMGSLLKHYVETADLDDPVLQKQVLVSQSMLDYEETWEKMQAATDPDEKQALREEAIADFKDALQAQRDLIKENYEDVRRPMWQTTLAEFLLYEYLQTIHAAADDFVEFGVPTEEQRTAWQEAVRESLIELTDADLTLFRHQGDIPRSMERDEFERKFKDTGLWARMMDQFYNLRTPFFLGKSGHFVALLPDDNEYYKTLGDHPEKMPVQADDPARERIRLREQGIERLEELVNDTSNKWGVRANALAIVARHQTALERFDEAQATLEDAAKTVNAKPKLAFQIELLKARLLDERGQRDEALSFLQTLHGHPQATADLRYRVLVVDMEHRIRLKTAH